MCGVLLLFNTTTNPTYYQMGGIIITVNYITHIFMFMPAHTVQGIIIVQVDDYLRDQTKHLIQLLDLLRF